MGKIELPPGSILPDHKSLPFFPAIVKRKMVQAKSKNLPFKISTIPAISLELCGPAGIKIPILLVLPPEVLESMSQIMTKIERAYMEISDEDKKPSDLKVACPLCGTNKLNVTVNTFVPNMIQIEFDCLNSECNAGFSSTYEPQIIIDANDQKEKTILEHDKNSGSQGTSE